jgi:hypothetical protein
LSVIGWLVVFELKFVTDNIALSMREMKWALSFVIFSFKLGTNKRKLLLFNFNAKTERVR